MSGSIIFITTFRIKNGALEKFKEAIRKSMDFLETNGPQLLAEVCIDENEMRAHGIQIHRNSESILSHWQLADPHMRDVMQHHNHACRYLWQAKRGRDGRDAATLLPGGSSFRNTSIRRF